jgi:hypothetical protein
MPITNTNGDGSQAVQQIIRLDASSAKGCGAVDSLRGGWLAVAVVGFGVTATGYPEHDVFGETRLAWPGEAGAATGTRAQ